MKKLYYIIAILIIAIIGIVFWLVDPHSLWTPPAGQTDDTLIRITYPRPGETVVSPITLTGEARGNWYFEASFPIVIVDWDGRIIGQGHAEAQSDWMTTEYVPFRATLTFVRLEINDANMLYATRGAIIFKNDNPSGDPAKDKAVEVPVVFK